MRFTRTYSYAGRRYALWVGDYSLELHTGPTRIGTRYWRRFVLALVGKHSVRVIGGN